MNGFKIMIDPERLDYYHIAKEITRAMTNSNLTKKQQDTLTFVAEQVLLAKLRYRSENLQDIIDREEK